MAARVQQQTRVLGLPWAFLTPVPLYGLGRSIAFHAPKAVLPQPCCRMALKRTAHQPLAIGPQTISCVTVGPPAGPQYRHPRPAKQLGRELFARDLVAVIPKLFVEIIIARRVCVEATEVGVEEPRVCAILILNGDAHASDLNRLRILFFAFYHRSHLKKWLSWVP